MAKRIGKLSAELELKSAEFSAGVKAAQADTENLSITMEKVPKAARAKEMSLKGVSRELNNTTSGVRSLAGSLTGTLGIVTRMTGAVGVVSGAVAAAGALLSKSADGMFDYARALDDADAAMRRFGRTPPAVTADAFLGEWEKKLQDITDEATAAWEAVRDNKRLSMDDQLRLRDEIVSRRMQRERIHWEERQHAAERLTIEFARQREEESRQREEESRNERVDRLEEEWRLEQRMREDGARAGIERRHRQHDEERAMVKDVVAMRERLERQAMSPLDRTRAEAQDLADQLSRVRHLMPTEDVRRIEDAIFSAFVRGSKELTDRMAKQQEQHLQRLEAQNRRFNDSQLRDLRAIGGTVHAINRGQYRGGH